MKCVVMVMVMIMILKSFICCCFCWMERKLDRWEKRMSSRAGPSEPQGPVMQRRITRTQTAGNLGEAIFDSEVVPSSLVEIAPILRVANEVEKTHPRVAYLCKLFFFELFDFRLPALKSEAHYCFCAYWVYIHSVVYLLLIPIYWVD